MAIPILALFMFPALAKEAEIEQPIGNQYVEAINVPNYYIGEAPKWTLCSCVEFAKWYLERQGEVWGWAGDMKPTSLIPYAGGLVITNEGQGHVAVINRVWQGKIELTEANWLPCQQTSRVIDMNDPKIVGYR